MEACVLIAGLHGRMLRELSAHTGVHFQGLHHAAALLRKRGGITARSQRRLRQLDDAFNLNRHVTEVSCREWHFEIMGDVLGGCGDAVLDLKAGIDGVHGSSDSLLQVSTVCFEDSGGSDHDDDTAATSGFESYYVGDAKDSATQTTAETLPMVDGEMQTTADLVNTTMFYDIVGLTDHVHGMALRSLATTVRAKALSLAQGIYGPEDGLRTRYLDLEPDAADGASLMDAAMDMHDDGGSFDFRFHPGYLDLFDGPRGSARKRGDYKALPVVGTIIDQRPAQCDAGAEHLFRDECCAQFSAGADVFRRDDRDAAAPRRSADDDDEPSADDEAAAFPADEEEEAAAEERDAAAPRRSADDDDEPSVSAAEEAAVEAAAQLAAKADAPERAAWLERKERATAARQAAEEAGC